MVFRMGSKHYCYGFPERFRLLFRSLSPFAEIALERRMVEGRDSIGMPLYRFDANEAGGLKLVHVDTRLARSATALVAQRRDRGEDASVFASIPAEPPVNALRAEANPSVPQDLLGDVNPVKSLVRVEGVADLHVCLTPSPAAGRTAMFFHDSSSE